jgi:DNA-nicking Smr family endonuclease
MNAGLQREKSLLLDTFLHSFRIRPCMEEEPHRVPVTNELDLHAFRPSEVAELLPEYFAECLEEGITTVRVIHGKGTGALRERVHILLGRLPEVREFQYPAGAASGGWGATWVFLHSPAPGSTADPTGG